jgi:HPt (histidine-containing phosphotransfer) domain-containing protein
MEEYKELPIAAMTADAISGVREKCMEVGMNDFITKPIDPNELYSSLSRWIQPGKKPALKKTKVKATIKKEDTMEIDNIHGLDTADGLRRINNNKVLYLKLLGKFVKNYSGFVPALRKSLEEGIAEESERMVHTLKGVSGNIGAKEIHDFTKVLNEKQKKNEKVDIDTEMEKLDALLAPMLEALSALLKESQEKGTRQDGDAELDIPRVRQLIEELETMLKDSDFEAAQKLGDLEKIQGINIFTAELNKLKDDVSDYDFDGALKTLENLKQRI